MFNVRLADLIICIENKYPYVRKMCGEYIAAIDKTDFTVSVTEEEILAEEDGRGFDKGYLESLALYRKIAEKLVQFDGFLMHGVVIEAEGQGIAFLARSGVGKSTHMELWRRMLGDRLTVVNGDKPLVRIQDGKIFAYGTPWSGKENMHSNVRTELKKVCFLERSETNNCLPVSKQDVFEKLMVQIYRPKNLEQLMKILDLLGTFIERTEFYNIMCNTQQEAAETAYKGLME